MNSSPYVELEQRVRSHEEKAIYALWASVLRLGLEDAAVALRSAIRSKKPFEAYEPLVWLYDDLDAPGSFVWLCGLFDLDPARARSAWRMNVRGLLK